MNQSLLLSRFIEVNQFAHKDIFKGTLFVWEAVGRIAPYLEEYFGKERVSEPFEQIGHPFIGQKVQIGGGSIVEHGACILPNTVIGRNCRIRSGAYLRGDNCVVGHCSELKNCLLMNGAQAAHFNYVGDSIIGNNAHLSAGAVTCNLKLDSSHIILHTLKGDHQTKLRKFGAVVGDFAQIGCNAILNPGSLIGKKAVVYPNLAFRGQLDDNCIAKLGQQITLIYKT